MLTFFACTCDTDGVPLKRKRGRPIGSKNKNPSAAAIRAFLNSGIDVPKRKRGRPPKVVYITFIPRFCHKPLSRACSFTR